MWVVLRRRARGYRVSPKYDQVRNYIAENRIWKVDGLKE